MRDHTISVEMGLLSNRISNLCLDTFNTLTSDFKPTTTNNEQAVLEANMQMAMVDYVIYSQLNSEYKKRVDESKKTLDKTLKDMGMESDV